jgi:CTP:molybdopterin cytidylyltransferase MocA
MGCQKLLAPFRGRLMIEYAIEAANAWQTLIVASPGVARYLQKTHAHIETVSNTSPERGMSYSLRLANSAIQPGIPMIVLLGDKPLITPELIAAVCNLGRDADIAHPLSSHGEPGHPVFLSARARRNVDALADGDSIRVLRDDPSLTKRTLPTDDRAAFFDVDTLEQL